MFVRLSEDHKEEHSFPFVWCDDCQQAQPLFFQVMLAEGGEEVGDLVCLRCKSIIATVHSCP